MNTARSRWFGGQTKRARMNLQGSIAIFLVLLIHFSMGHAHDLHKFVALVVLQFIYPDNLYDCGLCCSFTRWTSFATAAICNADAERGAMSILILVYSQVTQHLFKNIPSIHHLSISHYAAAPCARSCHCSVHPPCCSCCSPPT
jgi:hypothetical protein